MVNRLYKMWCAVALTAVLLLSACGKDFTSDINSLNDRQTAVSSRVDALETVMQSVNQNLEQLNVLTLAVEKGFYITEVKTTADGYELKLNNGHTFIWQKGPDNTLIPLPAVSITKINGFYFWTLNGTILTDGDGRPLRTSEVTPIVKYDYVNLQWVISIDGGVTFSSINVYASTVINNTVLLQVINTYLRDHSTTLISEEVLFQIVTTYIQRNYAELFNVEQLNEVIINHIHDNYTQLFSYELLQQIFNQYWTEYGGTHIDVDRLVTIIIDFIREHKELFVNNKVFYEIINSYIEVNKTTIFSDKLLLEVVNNFIDTHEDYINVEVLRQIIFRYIEEHQDVIIDTDFIRNILVRFVETNYVDIFNQNIITQVINNYIASNQTTIFNETLIREIITNYVKNNHTTIISDTQITELINNYIERNETTFINREVLVEIVSNYFERNYNLFIDRTVITQLINNYIEKHKTTLIDVDIITQIVSEYVEKYYTEIFNSEMLTQIINNYISENTTIIRQYVSQYAGIISDVDADSEKATFTLSDGTAIQLTVYDQLSTLRDRVQRIVVLPNANGNVTHSANAVRFRCVVTPTAMASVIVDKYQNNEFELDVIASDGGGSVTGMYHAEATHAGGGLIDVTSNIPSAPALVAFVVKDKHQKNGTDFTTEFYVVDDDKGSQSQDGTCPDGHHPHVIDLGLPSGTLWACCNVGASKPEDYGGYFAWGETGEKHDYSQNTYHGPQLSDAFDWDICATQYDVAYVQWGSNWRMPTAEQIEELAKYCQRGRVVGPNGKSLILPAAGFAMGTQIGYGKGARGDYWSGTYERATMPGPFELEYNPDNKGRLGTSTYYYGLSVRPVYNNTPSPSLALSEHYLSLMEGESANVKIISGSGNYDVSSSDKSVATATVSGNAITVKGVKQGGATITITDKQTKQKNDITVLVRAAATLKLSTSSLTVNVGETGTVTITSGSGSYSVSSSNTAVATASRSGNSITIKGVKAGTATVTVTDTQTKKTATVQVTVKEVAALKLSTSSLTVNVGETGTVTITSGSGSYSVSSSNTAVATANRSGNSITIKGVKAGTATITVTDTQTKKTATVKVTVKEVAAVALSEHFISLMVGETAKVQITSGSGSYSVSSSDKTVATATLSGKSVTIKGVKAGSTMVTVTDTQTKKTAMVEVMVKEVAALKLSSSSLTVNVGETGTVTITSGSGSYSVSSSNTAVATANRSGNSVTIKGVKAGTATVTVTDTQTKKTATVQVTVKESTALKLSTYSLTLRVGETKQVTIISGSGNYTINNPNGNVVGLTKIDSVLSFNGKAVGTVNVAITDTKTKQTATIKIQVTK